MENEMNSPVCYSMIPMEDGAGYCILCEEVVYEDEEGKLKNDFNMDGKIIMEAEKNLLHLQQILFALRVSI